MNVGPEIRRSPPGRKSVTPREQRKSEIRISKFEPRAFFLRGVQPTSATRRGPAYRARSLSYAVWIPACPGRTESQSARRLPVWANVRRGPPLLLQALRTHRPWRQLFPRCCRCRRYPAVQSPNREVGSSKQLISLPPFGEPILKHGRLHTRPSPAYRPGEYLGRCGCAGAAYSIRQYPKHHIARVCCG